MFDVTRSFCILEVFATIEGHARLLAASRRGVAELEAVLSAHPIDTASAQTRLLRDKEAIDAFIRATVGFERMDCMMTSVGRRDKRW